MLLLSIAVILLSEVTEKCAIFTKELAFIGFGHLIWISRFIYFEQGDAMLSSPKGRNNLFPKIFHGKIYELASQFCRQGLLSPINQHF